MASIPSSLRSRSATTGERFSSSSSLTFTRASHTRVCPREDGRELQVLCLQIRVVLANLFRRCTPEQHAPDLADRKTTLREDRLAAEDLLVGYELLLPRLESGELPVCVFGHWTEANFEHGIERDSSGRPRHGNGRHNEVMELSAIV